MVFFLLAFDYDAIQCAENKHTEKESQHSMHTVSWFSKILGWADYYLI